MARPAMYPVWATSDVVDPTSGKTNVVEPDAGHKTLGWNFKEYPPRQYFNWLARLTHRWIEYLDQIIMTPTSGLADRVGVLEAQTINARLVIIEVIGAASPHILDLPLPFTRNTTIIEAITIDLVSPTFTMCFPSWTATPATFDLGPVFLYTDTVDKIAVTHGSNYNGKTMKIYLRRIV